MKTSLHQSKKHKGFTLIELLVVITIIGILASIVVVNLNSTRGRGQDVAVKEQMSQIRAASEIYYSDNYGYSTKTAGATALTALCSASGSWTNTYFADTDFQRSITGIKSNAGADPYCVLGQGSVNEQSWMVVSPMRLGGQWCVDSYGSSKKWVGAYPPSISGANDAKCP